MTLDILREVFIDFKLSPAPFSTNKSATGEKIRPGAFWCELGKIETLDGQPQFPSLARLMAGLLSIPASNVDSEREFSIL